MHKRSRMPLQVAWILTALSVLGLVAFGASSKSEPGKSSAEQRGLIFSHKVHIKDNTIECATCHAAQTSKSGSDDLLPGHAACTDCHDVQAPDNCKMCHLEASPKLSARIATYSQRFSHERHVVTGKMSCAVCHADLDAPLASGQVGHLPAMAQCVKCHEEKDVRSECRTCHLPDEDLTPADHKLDWVRRHGLAATEGETVCVQCHNIRQPSVTDCQSCHNGDQVFSPHPRNYMSRHGQDAHLSDLSCAVCHEERDFCNTCHRQMNVLPAGHFRSGWVTRDGGRHAEEAQFDLESCIACHDAPGKEAVCARCHQK